MKQKRKDKTKKHKQHKLSKQKIKIQKKENRRLNNKTSDRTNTKMAKLTYKQIPLGGMIEKAGSSLDFKTGDWKVFKPCWDEKKCTHCMFCVVYCPDNCIPIANEEKGENQNNPSKKEINKDITNPKRKETNFDYCKGCGICAKVCPVKCIKMEEDKE